jgi:hypothetical protein
MNTNHITVEGRLSTLKLTAHLNRKTFQNVNTPYAQNITSLNECKEFWSP